ncbi:response regulator [Streptomyces sp. NPDC050315]|uniref:response regulator n=1 Tax=Streptomyces sp. NPDC050315 TaxID=3155039 RepID=UPI0034198FAE
MHILVVENDDAFRMLTVEAMDELGYTAIEADTAASALKVLEDSNQPLDLLFTDVKLPDLGGEVLASKARELRPLLPVLFASGYAESLNLPEGMHKIDKPFAIDQLRGKVVSILGTA